MIHSKITSKGQTTVPKQVRDALGLKPGELMTYQIQDGKVVLTKTKDIMDFFGILHVPGRKPITLEEMDQAIIDEVTERDRLSKA